MSSSTLIWFQPCVHLATITEKLETLLAIICDKLISEEHYMKSKNVTSYCPQDKELYPFTRARDGDGC